MDRLADSLVAAAETLNMASRDVRQVGGIGGLEDRLLVIRVSYLSG